MVYKIYGPKLAGDTIRMKYIFETPRSSLTSWSQSPIRAEYKIDYKLNARKYSSGSLAATSSTVSVSNQQLVDTLSFFYNRVDSDGVVIRHRICANMDALMPYLAGNTLQREADVVYEWVDPNVAPPGDTLYALTCGDIVGSTFRNALNSEIQKVHDKHENLLRLEYEEQCKTPSAINDFLANSHEISQYQYTLYYYDRQGNLIRTVAPKGVKQTSTDRSTNPGHDFVSSYNYNVYGGVIKQVTPDGGTTRFVYDRLNRLRFSQNTLQLGEDKFSYIKYDSLSRVIETGEAIATGLDTVILQQDSTESATYPLEGYPATLRYVTKTIYSEPYTTGPFPACDLENKQTFLHNRISYTTTDVDGNWTTDNDETYTLYGYDPHGNVRSLVQWASGMAQPKYMEYAYDLIGGKVKALHYYSLIDVGNAGTTYAVQDYDRYSHRYGYDAWNRLVEVKTTYDVSSTNLTGTTDVYNKYYDHGPLKRTALNPLGGSGATAVQGIDYTYTLQGWLKGINDVQTAGPGSDVGGGITSTARDVFGEIINYNDQDFSKTGSPFNSNAAVRLTNGNLYNGNIVSIEDKVFSDDVAVVIPFEDGAGFRYRYDQLNRITRADFHKYKTPGNGGPGWDPNGIFDEQFTYDANGNINTLMRYGPTDPTFTSKTIWDSLTYNYSYLNNSLSYVQEHAGLIYNDIGGNTGFTYDAKGRMIYDNFDKLRVYWRPDDKVERIERLTAVKPVPVVGTRWDYLYDAMGNRVKTVETDVPTSTVTSASHNIFNAGGNMMAIYNNANAYLPSERYIYGNDRTGLMAGSNGGALPSAKFYEIHDHLGNVRVVINAMKNGSGQAVVSKYFNYYAFGSVQPGRSLNGLQYQFGFNGQEKSDYLKGEGNHLTYRYREYDPRLGKFWSIDPLHATYPWNSTYAFAENRPIDGMDLEGKEWRPMNKIRDNTSVRLYDYETVIRNKATSMPIPTPPQATMRQDYSRTIYGSEAGYEYSKASFEQTMDIIVPGGPLVLKGIKGEEITKGDIFIEVFGIVPAFKWGSEALSVTMHGFKHAAAKNVPWQKIVKSTKSGAAKFMQGMDVEKLTKEAWDNGQEVTTGKPWKVYKSDKIIGANSGKETQYMRVELSETTKEIHGHPILEAEYKKLTK